MKGLLRVSAWLFMVVISCYSSWVGAESPNFVLYRDSSGFSIRYPENWSVKNRSKGAVDFVSPRESSSDSFREYVSVTVVDLESRLNLKQATDYMLDYLEKYITDFSLIWKEDAYLSDENACMVSYVGRQGQFRVRWKNIWTIKNNRLYAVTLKAESEKYDQYLDIAERMFNSFRIENY
jgi:hypothetical protein